MKPTNALML